MGYERRVLLSASLFHALNDAATVAVPMIFPILYNMGYIIHSYSHIGILSNLGLMTTFLFQIIVVHVSRKFDYKSMLCLSFIGISFSLILITSCQNFAVLLLFYLLFRVFDSFYHTIGLAWVSRTHPSHGIDLAMGVQSGSGNLGVVFAFVSVGYLIQRFNWQQPLLVWAGVCLLLGAVSFLAVKGFSLRTDEVDRLDFSSWLQTVKRIRKFVPGFIFGGSCWGLTVYFAPSLLHHKFEIPMGKTGLYLGLWIGLGTIATYSFGSLSRRLGRPRIFQGAFLVASFLLLLLGAANKPAMAIASLLLFGLFLFLLYPALQSYVGNAVPATNQAQAFSVVSNIQMLSGALISLVAGFLSDRFGISAPFLLLGAMGLGMALSSLNLIRLNDSKT